MSSQEEEDLFFQNNIGNIKLPEENIEKELEKEPDKDSDMNKIEEISEEEIEEDDDDEENNKEMKSFTIELLIHSKVMDNREEIKHCICHNYIIQNEDESTLKENENIFIEKEIIPNIEIPIIRITKNTKDKNELNNIESPDKFYIKMNELTKELKLKGFPMSGSMINVYINYTKNYVYFGTEPLDNKIILYSYMLEPNKDVIKLKIINYIQKRMLDGYTNAIINTYFRKPIQKNKNRKNKKENETMPSLDLKIYMPSMTNMDYFDKKEKKQKDDNSISLTEMEEDEEEDEDKIDYKKLSDANKRERKIGYIIEKVYAWRKLYNGYKDDNNKFIKYSLDEAAEKINVSKKSLDDYLLQIRLGRKMGFNFDDNKNEKIGTLRAFVEEKKKENNINIIKKERKPRKKKTKKENKEQKNSNNNLSIEINKNNKSSLSLKRNKSKSKSFKKK